MANIRSVSAISSSDAVLAAPMTNNFSQIVQALNSSAMNSENYGQSSILSQHVQANAVLAQHLSAGGFPNIKFSSGILTHNAFNFHVTAKGVQFVEFGAVSSKMPASGVVMGVYSKTITANSSARFTINWSDAIHGNPGFTTTPIPFASPAFEVHSTSGTAPQACAAYNLGSASGVFYCHLDETDAQTLTMRLFMHGPASA